MNDKSDHTSTELAAGRPLNAGTFAIQAIRSDPTLQPSTKHQYIKALQNFLDTGGNLLDPVALAGSVSYGRYFFYLPRGFLIVAVTISNCH